MTSDDGGVAVTDAGADVGPDVGQVCVYGHPLAELAPTPAHARQVSPFVPGAEALEDVAPASLDAMIVSAPAATVERRYVLALALRALKPGASLVALARKEKGGARIADELNGLGCEVEAAGRRHHRICRSTRPAEIIGLEATLTAGAPRFAPELGRWTQPGLFSWDRPDPGTDLLAAHLPTLTGHGADLGCGGGPVAQAVLASPGVTQLDLIDLDRRAIAAARRNVSDPRAAFHWADARQAALPSALDFVVMNPPFHEGGGAESRALGQDFIRAAHRLLRRGGVLWLVANRHLPYEPVLGPLFTRVEVRADRAGFKVLEAHR